MNSDLFFLFNFGIPIGMSGQLYFMATDGEIAYRQGSFDAFPESLSLDLEIASDSVTEEVDFLIASSSEAVFADMTDAVEADGGAVLTAFGEAAIGSDGDDLMMGDGGIEASVMAELLAGVADLAA